MTKKCLSFLFLLTAAVALSAASARKAAIGDILLSDGTAVSPEKLTKLDKANPPIAVAADIRADGSVLAVGLHISRDTPAWSPDGTAGNKTRFSALAATVTNGADNAERAAFTGAGDGGASWQKIAEADERGAKNARTDYPAFFFASDYARSQGFTGALAQGWYLPSIAELCAVYKNRRAINAALHRLHALDGSCAEDTLGTNWYWSSTQSAAKADYAWFIHFYNGYTADCPKNFTNLHALAVRVF